MKLSVCVDAVYAKRNFQESVQAIRSAGYEAIEMWSWWDKDLDHVQQTLNDTGMKLVACCTRFISLVDASMRDDYIRGLKESIAVAKRLNCRQLISQVGQELQGVSREEQRQSLIDGLCACVPILEQEDMVLLIEPLNTFVNHPGYYLSSSAEAFAIIKQVGSRHVKVLYDIYHQQITEGNLIATIRENIDWIGHFHAAGNPGRHELHTGELAYSRIFAAIRETDFSGYMGLEYFPIGEPVEGLTQLRNELGLHTGN